MAKPKRPRFDEEPLPTSTPAGGNAGFKTRDEWAQDDSLHKALNDIDPNSQRNQLTEPVKPVGLGRYAKQTEEWAPKYEQERQRRLANLPPLAEDDQGVVRQPGWNTHTQTMEWWKQNVYPTQLDPATNQPIPNNQALDPTGNPLPYGALMWDPHGAPYYGDGLAGVFKRNWSMITAPIKKPNWTEIQPTKVRDQAGMEGETKLPGQVKAAVQEVTNIGQEGDKPSLINMLPRAVAVSVQTVFDGLQEFAKKTKQGLSVAQGISQRESQRAISEGGAVIPMHPAAIRAAQEQTGKADSTKAWEEYFTTTEKRTNPFEADQALLGKGGVVDESYQAGRMFYTGAIEPMKRKEYIDRLRQGENAYLLAMELENPLAEMVGELALDPLNLNLGIGKKAVQAIRMLRSAGELVDDAADMGKILAGAENVSDVKNLDNFIKFNAEADKKLERTRNGLTSLARDRGVFKLTAPAARDDILGRITKISDLVVSENPNETGALLKAIAQAGDESADVRATGRAYVLTNPGASVYSSEAGRQLSLVLNHMGVLDGDKFLDGLKAAQDIGPEEVYKFTRGKLDAAVEQMVPDLNRRIQLEKDLKAGKQLTEWERELAHVPPAQKAALAFHNTARKFAWGPVDWFVANFGMDKNLPYFLGNVRSDVITTTVDVGVAAANPFEAGKSAQYLTEWNGTIPYGLTDTVGPSGMLDSAAKLRQGKGLIAASNKVQDWFGLNIGKKMFQDTITKLLRPGRKLPDVSPLVDAGMDQRVAQALVKRIIDNKSVDKALELTKAELTAKQLDVLTGLTWMDGKTEKVLRDFDIYDDVTQAIKQKDAGATAADVQAGIDKVFDDLAALGDEAADEPAMLSQNALGADGIMVASGDVAEDVHEIAAKSFQSSYVTTSMADEAINAAIDGKAAEAAMTGNLDLSQQVQAARQMAQQVEDAARQVIGESAQFSEEWTRRYADLMTGGGPVAIPTEWPDYIRTDADKVRFLAKESEVFADKHIVNMVNKYTGSTFTTVHEIPLDVAAQALGTRKGVKGNGVNDFEKLWRDAQLTTPPPQTMQEFRNRFWTEFYFQRQAGYTSTVRELKTQAAQQIVTTLGENPARLDRMNQANDVAKVYEGEVGKLQDLAGNIRQAAGEMGVNAPGDEDLLGIINQNLEGAEDTSQVVANTPPVKTDAGPWDIDAIGKKIRESLPQDPKKKYTYRGISKQQYEEQFKAAGELTSDGRNMIAGKAGELHVTDDTAQAVAHAGQDGVILAIDRASSKSIPSFKDIRRVKGDKLTAENVIAVYNARTGEILGTETAQAVAQQAPGKYRSLAEMGPAEARQALERHVAKPRTASETRKAELKTIRNQIITQPRHELDPSMSTALEEAAIDMSVAVRDGEPGQRMFSDGAFSGSTHSTYPEWYAEIERQAGGKDAVLKALDKIHKDKGADKGKTVERLKAIALDDVLKTDPRALLTTKNEDAAYRILLREIEEGVDLEAKYGSDDAVKLLDFVDEYDPGKAAADLVNQAAEENQRMMDMLRSIKGPTTPLPPVPYNGDYPPSLARTILEQKQGLDELRNTLKQSVVENYGKTIAVDPNPRLTVALDEWGKGAQKGFAEAKVIASDLAVKQRNFTLNNFSRKYGLDVGMAYILPYHFWYGRQYSKWMGRLATSPEVIAGYAKMKDYAAQAHAGLPEYERYTFNTNELLGLDSENPLYLNLEQALVPFYGLTGVDFNDSYKRTNWFTSAVDDLGKNGPSTHTLINLAIAGASYARGEKDAAARWGGRLIPQTRLLRDTMAWGHVNISDKIPVLDVDPAVGLFAGGLDPYMESKIRLALGTMVEDGQITKEEAIDSAYSQDGEIFQEAYSRAVGRDADMRGLGYFTGFSVRRKTPQDFASDQFWQDKRRLQAMRPNLSPDEYYEMTDQLYTQYPFGDILVLSRASDGSKDSDYAYSVMHRLPPGTSDDLLLTVGISRDMQAQFRESKGNMKDWDEKTQRKFMDGILELGALLKLPDDATDQEWDAARQAKSQMEKAAQSIWGDDVLDNYYQYNNIKYSEDSNAQADADKFMRQHPEIQEFMDFKASVYVNDQRATAYFSGMDDIERYYRSQMYGQVEQASGVKMSDIFDVQTEYYQIKDTNKAEAKRYKQQHPELQAYWDIKNARQRDIIKLTAQVGGNLKPARQPEIREGAQAETETQQAVLDALAPAEQPTWDDYKETLGGPLANLVADYLLDGKDLTPAAKDKLNAIADEEGVNLNLLLAEMEMSLNQE
jgi:hypothetical protein